MENESLVLDFLEWLISSPRPYDDVMNTWRTSCPRLTIWEDALNAGLVVVRSREVSLTAAGHDFLRARRSRMSLDRKEKSVT